MLYFLKYISFLLEAGSQKGQTPRTLAVQWNLLRPQKIESRYMKKHVFKMYFLNIDKAKTLLIESERHMYKPTQNQTKALHVSNN